MNTALWANKSSLSKWHLWHLTDFTIWAAFTFGGNLGWSAICHMERTGIQRDDVLTCFSSPQGSDSIFDRFFLPIRIAWCYWYTAHRLYVILMDEKKRKGDITSVPVSLNVSLSSVCDLPPVCLLSHAAACCWCTLSIFLASWVSWAMLFLPLIMHPRVKIKAT